MCNKRVRCYKMLRNNSLSSFWCWQMSAAAGIYSCYLQLSFTAVVYSCYLQLLFTAVIIQLLFTVESVGRWYLTGSNEKQATSFIFHIIYSLLWFTVHIIYSLHRLQFSSLTIHTIHSSHYLKANSTYYPPTNSSIFLKKIFKFQYRFAKEQIARMGTSKGFL
jgi:hypothetical protein